jgi:hypothetical protein
LEKYKDAPNYVVKLAKACVDRAFQANLLHRCRQIQDTRHNSIVIDWWSDDLTLSERQTDVELYIPCYLQRRFLSKGGKLLRERKPLPRVVLPPLPSPRRRSKRRKTDAEVEEEEKKEKERETCLAVLEYTIGQEEPMVMEEREEGREERPRKRMLDEHYFLLMEMMLPA